MNAASLFSHTPRRPPTSTLFPYTTLFRSGHLPLRLAAGRGVGHAVGVPVPGGRCAIIGARPPHIVAVRAGWARSEEHTSELQSHVNLVCRLLLEKKKSQLSCQKQLGLRGC